MIANPRVGQQSITKSPISEVNSIDWLAQQNGGQFDPVLFGDYRDPQDNILNNPFGNFFNDAFPIQDFSSPYNTGDIPSPELRGDLMKEIEVRQDSKQDDAPKTIGCQEMMSVAIDNNNHICFADHRDRERVNAKVKAGDANMDELCSQFKAKARCSITGAVIDQKDFNDIMDSKPKQGNVPTSN